MNCFKPPLLKITQSPWSRLQIARGKVVLSSDGQREVGVVGREEGWLSVNQPMKRSEKGNVENVA